MWKCPKCETINKEDVCVVCGEKRVIPVPVAEPAAASPEPVPVSVPETVQKTETEPEKKSSGKKLAISILCVIFVILIGAGVFVYMQLSKQEDAQKIEEEVALAQEMFENREYEQCVEKLQEIKNKYSQYNKSFDALYLEGYSFMELERYADAVICFEKALENGETAECYINLAVCYAKTEKFSKAKDVLENVSGEEAVKRYVEAEIHVAKDSPDDAIPDFEYVITNTNDENLKRRAYIALAELYREMRHQNKETFYYLDKQIEVMEEAVRNLKLEDDLTLTEMMGEAYFTNKEYDLAVQKFRRLIELGYVRDYVYYNIAIIHQQEGDLAEAESVLLEMKETYPENYQCYMQLAFVYIEIENQRPAEQRDYSKAVECYELAEKYAGSQHGSDLVQLERLIDTLRKNGWLD